MRSLVVSGIGAAALVIGSPAPAEPIEIGNEVPVVEAKTHEGTVVKLHEAGAEGWFLVYFYPKAATGG